MSGEHPVWTERMLQTLEPSEHDFQEFKGSRFIADGDVIAADFVSSMSKQVSAFVNSTGGRLYLGLDDDGVVDGGVSTRLKAGGTRAWLEDVITGCVEPALPRFNVFEVTAELPNSRILPGNAVYVIDLPASDNAPHQALDYRYYLRIAGKSRPMGNVHIQDILRRTRHPRVEVSRVSPYGTPERIASDPRGPKVQLALQVLIVNPGRRMARHVGIELILPRPLVNGEVRRRTLDEPGIHLTQQPGSLRFFKHHPTPLFPGQESHFTRLWIAVHAGNAALIRGGAAVRWRAYADDAPPREGEQPLQRFAAVRRALKYRGRP